MLQYIFIHAEASNTMDRKTIVSKTMDRKTIGRFAQPNIGSKKKNSWGVAPDPVEGGYPSPSNPQIGGATTPPDKGGCCPPL